MIAQVKKSQNRRRKPRIPTQVVTTVTARRGMLQKPLSVITRERTISGMVQVRKGGGLTIRARTGVPRLA